MIHPSYTELMKALNHDVESGEAPVVNSRYSVVIASARRARQIIGGDEPLIAGNIDGKKPLSIAIDELYTGKVKIVGDDEEEEYEIVGTAEADPFSGKISNESPIAQALIGRKVGDVVKIPLPMGEIEVKIVDVK